MRRKNIATKSTMCTFRDFLCYHVHMDTITTVVAREHFSELINRTAYGKERIVLSRRGKDLLALIPLEDLRLIELAEDLLDTRDAKIALKEYENGQVVSLEELERQLKKGDDV